MSPEADLNQDGIVDVLDLSILVSNWGTNNPEVDLNDDGIVDVLDLSILVSSWGQTATVSNIIAFRDSSGNAANTTNLSVTIPASVQEGDLLLLVGTRSATDTAPTPVGWTLLSGYPKDGGSHRVYTWWKIASNGDATTLVSISSPGINKMSLQVIAYSAIDQLTPIGVESFAPETNPDLTRSAPGATATADDMWAVTVHGYRGSDPSNWTTPIGMTKRDERYTTGDGAVAVLVSDSAGSIGATGIIFGPKDASLTATETNNGFGITLLLAPGVTEPVAPATPSSLNATAGDAQVTLAWGSVSGADSYQVYRSLSPESGFSAIQSDLSVATHIDTGLTNGTTYYYRVTATNQYGSSGFSETVSAVPTESIITLPRFAGDPMPLVTGKSFWGAAINGNGDPVPRHETPSGASLSIRRTFYQWHHHESVPNGWLYSTVRDDHANNRLPFVSTKTPPWGEFASGIHDARIDQLLIELESYNKPTWLCFHHEPENDIGEAGTIAEWRSMQSRVRTRIDALSIQNVAFMPILMYWTWVPASGRNPEDWWVADCFDGFFVDIYRDTEDGDMFSGDRWVDFVQWCENKGLPFGTGEWGNRGTDAQAAQEMQDFWDWGFINNKDMIGHCYFDSDLNSDTGGWTLSGEPLNKFHDILSNDTRVMRINDLP